MFCVGPNRKRKSPDKIESLRSGGERPAVPGGPAASPSGILGNPFKSMRLSPIPKTGHDHRTPKRKRRHKDSGATSSGSSEDMAGFEAIPMVEMVERDALWTGDAAARLYQPYKGQLKLSVYINCGHLTVHVIRARHLSSKFKRVCDTYAKVSLVPEDSKRPQWKTETIYDTNSPLFDEKFSLELVDGDLKKRLLITAWCRDAGGKGATEFLGCMSFGVKNIYSDTKSVSGWYYLLADEVGRRKHLQVVTRRAALHNRPPAVIPRVNQDLKFMDPHLLVLKKGKNGYGFTVSGNSPVKVCRVDPGSAAEAAGLKPDDFIVRIDGLNVSRSTADSVARIIKHTSKQLVLEVQRPNTVPKMASSPWKPMSMSTPRYQQGTQPTKRRQFGTALPPIQQFNIENQPTLYEQKPDFKDSMAMMPPFLSSTTPITGNLQKIRTNMFPYGASHQHTEVLRPSEGYPAFHDFGKENIENTPMIPHAGMWKSYEDVENTPMLPPSVWEAYRAQCQREQGPMYAEPQYTHYNFALPAEQFHHKQASRNTGKRVTFKEFS